MNPKLFRLCAVAWLFLDAALPSDPGDWLDLLNKGGTVGLLVLIVGAFWKGLIVSKTTYDAVVKERDALRAASDALLTSYQQREREEALWRRDRALRGPRDDGGNQP